jgi:transcriptional regulator with XRE-family HTH domain
MSTNTLKNRACLVATPAERLKAALELRDMKPSELSLKTGLSKSTLSYYLNGRFQPKQDKIYLMAKELNVSPSWLMGMNVNTEGNLDENCIATGTGGHTIKEFRESVDKSCNITHSFDEEAAMANLFSSNSDRDKQFFLHIIGIYKAMKETTLDSKDKEFMRKYHALDESSQRLIEEMIDKLLLTQQMAQKNATTADSDGGESTQKGTPSLQ